MLRRIACALVLAGIAAAQIQTSRITGTIYDPNRAVIPNAAITVTNKGTNIARRVGSDEVGSYVVPSLDPGVYDVNVTASGFQTTVRRDVELLVGKDLILDVDLVLGETSVNR